MTRDEIDSLRVGSIISTTLDTVCLEPRPDARWVEREVVDIFARQEDIHGKLFVCGYTRFGDSARLSFSAKEGENNVRVERI